MTSSVIVKSISGTVKAIAVDEKERSLEVGDTVFPYEQIITGDTGTIVIMFSNGSRMDLGHNSNVILNDETLNTNSGNKHNGQSIDNIQDEVAVIQKTIADDKNFDPSKLEAPATGTGKIIEDDGHTIVQIKYLNPELTPESGFETVGISNEFEQMREELLLNPLQPSISSVFEPTQSVILPLASVSVEVAIDVEEPLPSGFPVIATGNTANIPEGTSQNTKAVAFNISLDQIFDTDVQVSYELRPLTADNPEDWFDGDLIQTVTIPAGQTSFLVTVYINEDHLDEGNETFDIVLTDAVNAKINPDASSAVVTIYDDDTTPVANPDTNITQGVGGTASGNVLTDADHSNEYGTFSDNADTDEDGDTLVVTNPGEFKGVYGTLVLNANGSYTYTVNSSVSDLIVGESVTDQFSYAISDTYNAEQTSALTITIVGTNSFPSVTVVYGTDGVVNEAGLLFDGGDEPNPATASGALDIMSGKDVPITVEIGGIDVTGGGEVPGTYGELEIAIVDGVYQWSYTLTSSAPHTNPNNIGSADQFPEDAFDVVVTDNNGDSTAEDGVQTTEQIKILINDDGPVAVADQASQSAEDSSIVYNVINNTDGTSDAVGADGATLTRATVNTGAGIAAFLANGEITYNPVDGETGTFLIDYTLTDADGDTSDATLTITLAEDSEPTIGPESGTVYETQITDTVEGDFDIVSNDAVAAVRIQDVNGDWVDVTSGGTVTGEYGTLIVTAAGHWTYTLSASTTDHGPVDNGSNSINDVFALEVEDSDGDVQNNTLTIAVVDDVPSVSGLTTSVAENSGKTNLGDAVTVLSIDGGLDGIQSIGITGGAQGGSLVIVNGDLIYTAPTNVDNTNGAVEESFTVTVTDGDNDSATSTVTVSITDNNVPSLTVSDVQVDETGGLDTVNGELKFEYGNDGAGRLTLSASGATWAEETRTLAANDGSWTLGVNDNMSYTFTQHQVMSHPDTEDPNDTIVINVTANVVDSDGSTTGDQTFKITVNDDGPVVTDYDGVINNSVNNSLNGILDYGLGEDGLGSISFSMASSSVPLTSNGNAIQTTSVDTDGDGLETLVGYVDQNNNGYEVGEEVFTFSPTSDDAVNGTYALTLSSVLDLPATSVSLSFTGITAGGPVESLDVGTELTITPVNGGLVNASNGFVGIGNNANMDVGESAQYTFNTTLINNLQLDLKHVGSGGSDKISWETYNSLDQANTTDTGSMLIGNDSTLTSPITANHDFDTIIITMDSGSFKIGGITYTDQGDPQDILMSFDYQASDSDGDSINGSIDVTVSATSFTDLSTSNFLSDQDSVDTTGLT